MGVLLRLHNILETYNGKIHPNPLEYVLSSMSRILSDTFRLLTAAFGLLTLGVNGY